MKLKDWEINDLFGQFAEGSAEENYEDAVRSAKNGNVHMAALLLGAASKYISDKETMPEPLVLYITVILNDVSSEATSTPEKADAPKRARKIVEALNLKSDHRKRNLTGKEKERLHDAQLAQLYMCIEINKGASAYSTAKKAAEKFTDAVDSFTGGSDYIDDNRVKAYISLYKRRDKNMDRFLELIPFLTGKIKAIKS